MPRRVVIIGASADRRKFGNKAVRAYLHSGWEVLPVNPRGGRIENVPVLTSLGDAPRPVDRVLLYLPPETGLTVLAGIAALAPAEFIVNPGAESDELLAEAERLGLEPLQACGIIEVGRSPAEFGD
jgi:predicted CoA-binding protein